MSTVVTAKKCPRTVFEKEATDLKYLRDSSQYSVKFSIYSYVMKF
jgi:hypothetical protein